MKKKKEFAIGEEFQFEQVRLKVEDRLVYSCPCLGCYFDNKGFYCFDKEIYKSIGECCKEKRTDGKDVIFVKVEE